MRDPSKQPADFLQLVQLDLRLGDSPQHLALSSSEHPDTVTVELPLAADTKVLGFRAYEARGLKAVLHLFQEGLFNGFARAGSGSSLRLFSLLRPTCADLAGPDDPPGAGNEEPETALPRNARDAQMDP